MIQKNEKFINKLNFDISVEECISELKPHPKFDTCTFDNYNCDDNYPSQASLKSTLQNLATTKRVEVKKGLFSKFKKQTEVKLEHYYIDGTYGIGKTHLLSALFHAFNGTKAFLSFTELTYFMNYLGIEKTIETFEKHQLLLIDEFDLDDPATTRMFVRLVNAIKHKTNIVMTSNRLPKELGGGKFDTSQFARELGVIANDFTQLSVEGKSFRLKLTEWKKGFDTSSFEHTYNTIPSTRGVIKTTFDELMASLQSYHPFKFFVIPKDADVIFLDGLDTFTNLNNALRFTMFLDVCYYYDTKLFILSDEDDNIFADEIMDTTFERQFLRCKSRLTELALFYKS